MLDLFLKQIFFSLKRGTKLRNSAKNACRLHIKQKETVKEKEYFSSFKTTMYDVNNWICGRNVYCLPNETRLVEPLRFRAPVKVKVNKIKAI